MEPLDEVKQAGLLVWDCIHEHEKQEAMLYAGRNSNGVQVDILAIRDEEGWSYFLVRRLAPHEQSTACFVASTGERFAWFEEVERQIDAVSELLRAYVWLCEMETHPERFV